MTKPMSALRQRMIDDMTIRNMSPNTQKIYIHAVANFSAFHGRSPDKLDLRGRARLSAASHRARPQGHLDQPDHGCLALLLRHDARPEAMSPSRSRSPRKDDTLPAVLTREEVVRLLEGGARSQDANGLHHHLCRRPARLRGRSR